jgi:hypothetical protein
LSPDTLILGDFRLFFMFSNRLGCGTSLLITAVGTFLLLLAMGWIRL